MPPFPAPYQKILTCARQQIWADNAGRDMWRGFFLVGKRIGTRAMWLPLEQRTSGSVCQIF